MASESELKEQALEEFRMTCESDFKSRAKQLIKEVVDCQARIQGLEKQIPPRILAANSLS